MSNPNSPNFNPGGIKDRIDSRDYQLVEVGSATSPFDWDTGFDIEVKLGAKLPVKDQNGSFSCGGQAWSQYAGVLEAVFDGSLEERSAKFLYAQTYQHGGGSSGRDNAEIFINEGACRESVLTSYKNGNPPDEAFMTRGQDITDAAWLDAKSDKGFSYAQTGTNIDEVARALRDNNGVILGIDGQNNGTWTSAFPKVPTKVEWRHWVYCGRAKKVHGKKFIGFLNSWGDKVGEQGWQYIGEDYFTSYVWSGWTHVFSVPPATSFHHVFAKPIVFNERSDEVKALQTALQIDKEFPETVIPTGFYGDITRRAVLAFRKKYSIDSSTDPLGKSCGPLTRAKLNQLFGV